MYNQESENVYRQEYVPQEYVPYESYTPESHKSHEPYEPTYTEPYPAYQSNAPYPPYSSYPPDTQNATQYSEYTGYSDYPQQPEQPYREEKAQRPSYPENRSRHITKVEAMGMVGRFKQWIVIGSVLAFGLLSGLAFTHVTGIASQAVGGGFPFHDDDRGPSRHFHEPSQHGFLQQQQGGFSIGNNGPAQGPVSGSNVS